MDRSGPPFFNVMGRMPFNNHQYPGPPPSQEFFRPITPGGPLYPGHHQQPPYPGVQQPMIRPPPPFERTPMVDVIHTPAYDDRDERGMSPPSRRWEEEDSRSYSPRYQQQQQNHRRDSNWRGRRSRSRSRSPPPRRRSRSRSSSRSRGRGSRYRSPSRSPDRFDRRSRSRSRSRSFTPEFDKGRSAVKNLEPPSRTIVVKGLPLNCEEKTVFHLVTGAGLQPVDVRILKKTPTGQSRGFGFVEFADVQEAKRWMEHTKGFIQVDRCCASLQYSHSKFAPSGPSGYIVETRPTPRKSFSPPAPQASPVVNIPSHSQYRIGDWLCPKCKANNFKRRDTCFKCGSRKPHGAGRVSSIDNGHSQMSSVPCDTLLFLDLPVVCDQLMIMNGLKEITSLVPVRITVAPNSNFAYVQMASLADAAQLLTTATAVSKLVIEDKEIPVAYSRLSLTAILTGANLTQSGQSSGHTEALLRQLVGANLPGTDTNRAAAVAAALGVPARAESTNMAAAVAQTAIKKAQVMRQVTQQILAEQVQAVQNAQLAAASLLVPGAALLLKQRQQQNAVHAIQEAANAQQQTSSALARLGTVHTPFGELPRYPNPDVTQYQYEETSKLYFDPSTGLYYDGNSQYYYNAETQQWLYWDAQYSTYLPAPTTDQEEPDKSTSTGKSAGQPETAKSKGTVANKEKEKEEKVKMAKKIQKDMERWAKQTSQRKKPSAAASSAAAVDAGAVEADEEPISGPAPVISHKQSASADTGFSILEKAKARAGLVTYEGDSDEEQPTLAQRDAGITAKQLPIAMVEEVDTDWSRLACLLCRRQFPTKEVLVKHQQFSELHKQNLEEKIAQQGPSMVDDSSDKNQPGYRDRAKERRQKYGTTMELPRPNRLKEKYLDSVGSGSAAFQPPPTAQSNVLGADNIGNKLLKTMGWHEGQGLGRTNQGIVDPVTQERRVAGAGLGSVGAVVKSGPNANYKDNARAALRERYEGIQED